MVIALPSWGLDRSRLGDVLFDDEGHGFVKKENEIFGYGAILEFLDEHLRGPPMSP